MHRQELKEQTESIFNDLPIEVQYYINSLSDEIIDHYDFIFQLWELATNQAETITADNLREILRAKVVHDRNDIKSFKSRLKNE